uniref:Uncharacterized protein n=1 Tax=Rhizophora mucronata TaxID=61149 RepID=A0A2P2PMC8_RHIMU
MWIYTKVGIGRLHNQVTFSNT